MPQNSYTLHLPQNPRSCVVFSSPHSGAAYRADFLSSSRLDSTAIRSSEDAFVDDLFAAAPEFGAPLLCGKAPRAYVDLNRAVSELDPALIQGAVIKGINPAVAAGLGVIPRVVANGQVIQTGKISMETAQGRLARYYMPYHDRLAKLLREQREAFGLAVLFDCHSMPREALKSAPYIGRRRPDVILGNRFGV
ncbi:MAG: N-formylglutamate amidohydrolase, partial [Alphaproteobacteria bacterium]